MLHALLNVGGNANTDASNAVQYGLSYANANNDTSNQNTNLGSRLSFELSQFIVTPTLPEGRRQESIQSTSVTFNVKTWKKHKGSLKMRHRLSDCYSKICSMEVLERGAADACEPRKDTLEVSEFLSDKDNILRGIQIALRNHTLELSDYHIYYKTERGKRRLIADLPLVPDRIVHCAIAEVIEDPLNRTLIYQTHASIRGHGTHTAMAATRRAFHNDPRLCYGLSMDIDQCYASVPPQRVKAMLREYIKDDELLILLDRIIDNYNRTGHTGMALGGRLSPLMVNLYLSPLDHHLKQDCHVHHFQRYMDNYFIFGYSKEWLRQIEAEVEAGLGELGLKLNDNTVLQPVDSTHGIDMVGWVVYSDHVLIRKKTKLKMKRTFARIQNKLDRCIPLDEHDMGSINSYLGSLKWFDSYNLRRKVVDPVMDRIEE